jgi:hypothetical protein
MKKPVNNQQLRAGWPFLHLWIIRLDQASAIRCLLVGIILLCSIVAKSQVIVLNQSFSSDTLIAPFPCKTPAYGMKLSGNVVLLTDSSLVRVVLIDAYDNHLLLYEAYPLITTDSSFTFSGGCDETCFMNGIVPDSLRIDIINAMVTLDTLKLDTVPITDATALQAQAKWNNDSVKISIMNQRIQEEHMYWRAGRTSLTGLSFTEKEQLIDIKYNIEGYDYYKGGIYQKNSSQTGSASTNVIVDEFDWRNRHDANETDSYYYDGDPNPNTEERSGWSTIPRNQSPCNSCMSFTVIAQIEAYANLFFNNNTGNPNTNLLHHIDVDLSELQVMRCINNPVPCGSYYFGGAASIYNYVINNLIQNEECFPYNLAPNDPTCTTYCNPPSELIKISGALWFQENNDDYIKKLLIQYGPLAIDFPNLFGPGLGHMMLLVGYKTNKVGDTVYYGTGENDPSIVIDITGSINGTTSWIFKDSYAENWYYYSLDLPSAISPIECRYIFGDVIRTQTPTDILCSDEDGDGYYWWGIHRNQNGSQVNPYPDCNCPPGVNADSADCNDFDLHSGPYELDVSSNNPLYECKNNPCQSQEGYLSINSNYPDKEWYDDRHVYQSIMIEPGVTLKIHRQVFFTPGAKIIVKPGARLEVESTLPEWPARLTAGCGQFWGGIEVRGNSDAPQDGTSQGTVILNNCIIENALYGVRNFEPEYETDMGGVTIPGHSGGIIHATKTIYRNNKIGAVFAPYSYENSDSWFNDCTFEETDTLIDNSFSTYLMTINGTDGIGFTNCRFFNDEAACEYKSFGIYAYNSTFTFNGGNTTTNIENFKNLHYGIYTLANSSLDGFSLTHSKFINNIRGVYTSAYSGERITENIFNIPPDCQNCVSRYGVYLNESNGYKIEENTFTKLNPMSQENGDIGIYIRNSGPFGNEVYKNHFSYLNNAAVAAGINRRVVPPIGLCFKCNDFHHNIRDIFVNYGLEPPSQELGVAYYHGSTTVPAGNVFSDLNTMDFENYVPPANNVLYSYYNGDYLQNPDPFVNLLKNGTINQNQCPSKLLEDNPDSIRQERQFAQNSVDSFSLELNLLIDGGNTPALNEEVITSVPGQALEIYDDLLLKSPNLSDTVLNSAIEKEEVLNNALLRDIMVSNPHSAKRDSLIQKLDQRVVPMPDSMKAEIMEGMTYLSTREMLESEISINVVKERGLLHAIERNFRNSPTRTAYLDSLKKLMINDNHPESKYTLAFIYLEQDSIAKANSTLSSIPVNFSFSLKDQETHQLYLDYFTILEQILVNNQSYPEFDSTQVNGLFGLASNDFYLPGVYARNMLIAGGLLNYSEPIYLADSSSTGPSLPIKRNNGNGRNLKTEMKDYVKVFPNPAKDYVIIEFFCITNLEKPEVQIKIIDLSGTRVEIKESSKNYDQILIRTNGFVPGYYFVELNVNNQQTAFTKFILVK